MTPHEIFLRSQERRWLRRFVDYDSIDTATMVAVRKEFAEEYGYDRLHEIIREVTIQVAMEK